MKLPLIRVGHGYDLHRLVAGRELILGGIKIPYSKGLLGHSDGDCLMHALADSLLGALGLQDIGFFFPDSDSRFKNLDSVIILQKAKQEYILAGYEISNIDLTIVAQEPRIQPYIRSIKEKLSQVLEIGANQIGIKATTNEGLGPVGRNKAISCFSICSLTRRIEN